MAWFENWVWRRLTRPSQKVCRLPKSLPRSKEFQKSCLPSATPASLQTPSSALASENFLADSLSYTSNSFRLAFALSIFLYTFCLASDLNLQNHTCQANSNHISLLELKSGKKKGRKNKNIIYRQCSWRVSFLREAFQAQFLRQVWSRCFENGVEDPEEETRQANFYLGQ